MSDLARIAANQSRLVWRGLADEGLYEFEWSDSSALEKVEFAVSRTGIIFWRGWAEFSETHLSMTYTTPIARLPFWPLTRDIEGIVRIGGDGKNPAYAPIIWEGDDSEDPGMLWINAGFESTGWSRANMSTVIFPPE